MRPSTTTFDLGGNELRVGTTINNNPTVQDPYNSTFAWGYPYVPSGVAPTPLPSRVLATGFNNIIVIDYTVFAWCNHSLNLEAGAYMTVGTWWLARLRQRLRRRSQGAIPYLRAAYEWDWNAQAFHVSALYMQSNVNPLSGVLPTDGSMGRDH